MRRSHWACIMCASAKIFERPMREQQLHRLTRLCAVFGVCCAAFLAGCGGKEGGATQVAAKVNDKELTVHQINFVLQQNPQMAAAGGSEAPRQVLERLIDQEVTLQQALDQKMDRDPNVVAAIEAAKREITSRAYMERLLAKLPTPSAEDVQAYFNSKPELFAQRQIYSITEMQLAGPVDKLQTLHDQIQAGQSIDAITQWARANQIRTGVNRGNRPAEALPLNILSQLANVSLGHGVSLSEGGTARIYFVDARQPAPVTLEQARTAIQTAILNERKRQAAQDEVKRLRGVAKIEYLGTFAAAASAPADKPAQLVVDPASRAASGGLDDATLKKGLGLK